VGIPLNTDISLEFFLEIVCAVNDRIKCFVIDSSFNGNIEPDGFEIVLRITIGLSIDHYLPEIVNAPLLCADTESDSLT
jgi:hypothetical protein